MRITVSIYYGGFALALTGVFMALSAIISLIFHDGSAATLGVSGLITAVFGMFPMLFIPKRPDVSIRESILVVVFGWMACSLAGAIPFYLYGQPFTLTNAFFESISGFTTTGASILSSPESLPRGLLFWRSMTHWLGGVGIVAFALLVMPRLGQANRPLLQQEYSGIGAPSYLARAKDITRGLFMVYIGLTAVETIILIAVGMDWFDAVTNSLATISTGGFSVRNSSIAYYQSPLIEAIIMVFMVFGAINFLFLHGLLTRPKLTKFGWEVARSYLIMLVVAIGITVYVIDGTVYHTFAESLRYGAFQVITLATQCGFGSADSSVWPLQAQIIILVVAIIGGSAGSTAGAIKIDRIVLFFKLLRFRFHNLVHPNVVAAIRVDGRVIPLDNIERSVFYIPVYFGVLGLSSLLLSWVGMTAIDSFSGSVAILANAGPGMGSLGTMENYSQVPHLGKWIIMGVMFLGRLEVFALVLPFTRGFWRT